MATRAIYGVLGYPLKHSLSPAMHNAAFAGLGIDAEYRFFEVVPEDFTVFMQSLDRQGISGLNVTVPYKEKVFPFIAPDAASAYLKALRAVNTIVRRAPLWYGYNTDAAGFTRHLKEQFDPSGKTAAVIGAGGASRAVTCALAAEGVAQLRIYDIDEAKSAGVVEMLKSVFPEVPVRRARSVDELELASAQLLVNATPAGMSASDPCPVRADALHGGLFVYDLIYNPAETALMRAASAAGAKVSNGLGMLLYQGAAAFELFTGKPAPVAVMRRALEEGVHKAC